MWLCVVSNEIQSIFLIHCVSTLTDSVRRIREIFCQAHICHLATDQELVLVHKLYAEKYPRITRFTTKIYIYYRNATRYAAISYWCNYSTQRLRSFFEFYTHGCHRISQRFLNTSRRVQFEFN